MENKTKKEEIDQKLAYYFVFKHKISFMDMFLSKCWGAKKFERYYYQIPMQLIENVAVFGARSFGKSCVLEGAILHTLYSFPNEESLLTALRRLHIRDRCENIISYIFAHPYLRQWTLKGQKSSVVRSPYYEIRLKNGHSFAGIATTEDPRSINVQGRHCVRRFQEESQYTTRESWEKLVPAVSPKGCKDMIVGCVNGQVDSVYREIYDTQLYTVLGYTSYMEPHYNVDLDDSYIKVFGGKDSESYVQSCRGEWGSPTWSAWDMQAVINCIKRDGDKEMLMNEVTLRKNDFEDLGRNPRVSFPTLLRPFTGKEVILGIDIGDMEPTCILPFVEIEPDKFRLDTLIMIDGKIIVEDQLVIIDYLADFYAASLLGIDVTEGKGKSIATMLVNSQTYKDKHYNARVCFVGFNEKMTIEKIDNKTEIREYVKEYTHLLCQNRFQEGKFEIYSSNKLLGDFEKEKKTRSIDRLKIATPANVHTTDAFRCFAKAWFTKFGYTVKPEDSRKKKIIMPLWGKGVDVYARKKEDDRPNIVKNSSYR